MAKARRGRPLKFGQPSRVAALTLPDDVIESLRVMNPDIGRAIVALVRARQSGQTAPRPRPVVDTARAGKREALIIVNPTSLPSLRNCSLMRITDDKAIITLDPGAGAAELEIAVVDRLSEPGLAREQRAALRLLLGVLRKWRKDRRVTVHPRSIVVLES